MVPMSDLFTLISFAVLGLYVSKKGTFRRSKAAPPPLPETSNTAILDVIAEGWEPMSSRALFAKLGMADGFAMTEFPLSSKELFLKLGMPEGFPVAPEPEPAKAQPAKEVSVDLPPEILREEVPLQAWEIAHADRASV
ncbi:hypothetical protein [Rhodanobacter thiooxydans]|uniref:hypothetical protein n=1 Tax=Rhodanobacter thiooxydans TaxID=416169 RepID=UPI000A942057|nr:hypothetical protein [Rhodanobacter thiooxydans]UJJ56670.1 hypothetical protein LRK53_18855 [Rhodanobacter thiooxydans]